MRYLCDANPWLAMAVEIHPHHDSARRWMEGLSDDDLALFNRATQTSFLRLLTQPIATGYEPVSMARAWALYDLLMEDDRVSWMAEPEGLEALWRRLAKQSAPSPKLWMDAYLAAFAIRGNCRLLTFDQGFTRFEREGLDLLLLS
jgi:uncharacterized protein